MGIGEADDLCAAQGFTSEQPVKPAIMCLWSQVTGLRHENSPLQRRRHRSRAEFPKKSFIFINLSFWRNEDLVLSRGWATRCRPYSACSTLALFVSSRSPFSPRTLALFPCRRLRIHPRKWGFSTPVLIRLKPASSVFSPSLRMTIAYYGAASYRLWLTNQLMSQHRIGNLTLWV